MRHYRKAYLATSLSFGRNLRFVCELAKAMKACGYEITSKWVLDEDPSWGLNAEQIKERDLKAIENSDLLVADITKPSIGVGMEIMYALMKDKKVICVTKRELPISGLIRGERRIKIIILERDEELKERLKKELMIDDKRGKNR
jgi:nucleoside 2-deoxyribosyltransferase